MKHLLSLEQLSGADMTAILTATTAMKRQRGQSGPQPLAGQTWAMIFSKSSTRTRVSFEVGIHELGGNALFLNKNDIQIGRGETIRDTARVLERFVHGLIVRTYDHAEVVELARHGRIPVVNGLTDFLHPCQIYSDAFTMAERWAAPGSELLGALRGRKVAYFGDCSFNMANSWILGAAHFGMKVALAGPAEFAPGAKIRAQLAADGFREDAFHFTTDPFEAARDADVVYTDVWASMGQEEETAARLARMAPYAITAKLFAAAKPEALFMHCLPAHAGEEVAQEVLDNPRCIIFDEAENRLHMQKAILASLAASARQG